MEHRMRVLSKTVGLALAAAAGLMGAGYYWLLRRPLARTQGMLKIPHGLEDEVEIIRDRWGIPHIYAENEKDLFFAQGFVHAQDRLWQMDLSRRLVAGRLSEVMGEAATPVDRWMRILGMRRVAKREVELLDSNTRPLLQAYADGVSARVAQGRLPVEFAILRYKPEPWTPADTLSWNKMMSWSLSVNWETELLRAQLVARLGPDGAAELEPIYSEELPFIVPPGVDYSAIRGTAVERAQDARPFTGPAARSGLGSNNWVVSGSRTDTGMPLLANDMHLPLGMPCIWYENHLVGGDLNVTGVTFPGIPGVVSGHNGHVAWGYTNGFPDVQDLYLENLRRAGDGRVEYEYKGEWLEAQVIHEEIKIKGSEPVVEEVIITRHGPIINALASDLAGEGPLALRWVSLEPDTMVQGLLEMPRARDCLEFREALRHWTAPVQNTVYADTKGNIAYSYPGKVPIRAKGDGRVPVPGWTGEYEWTDYIPFEELPHMVNPPQGYIATANNRVTDEEYPHFFGRDFGTGYRARRITELIEARDQVDVSYFKRMHMDQISVPARTVAGHVGALKVDDPELVPVVEMMRNWNGALSADDPAAAVYQVFVRRMVYMMLSDKLGDLTERYAGKGPTPVLMEGSLFGHRALEWLVKNLGEPDSHWYDLGNGETREDVMQSALGETVEFLSSELGPEIEDWAWGKLHALTFAHVLGQVKPFDRLFNRGPFPVGGDHHTLWFTGANVHDLGSEDMVGPPFRFIADLGDLSRSLGLLVPGQSGQPGSRHYDDQVNAWFEGGYHPMLYAREDVEREAEGVLRLVPHAPGE